MKRTKVILILIMFVLINLFAISHAEEGKEMPEHIESGKEGTIEIQMSEPVNKENIIKVYTCKMAEHVDIAYLQDGVCPKCGMELEEREVHEVFVCPMEEHQDKVYLREMKCIDCGMKTKKLEKLPEKKTGKEERKHEPGHEAMEMDEDM